MLTQHLRAIERSFRDYVRADWTNGVHKGSTNFAEVFAFLVEELDLGCEHQELLELYNAVRNLIHNNGVYYPQTRRKQEPRPLNILTYRGTTYPFETKRIVEFTDWDFCQMLLKDCLDLLIVVVNHYKITRLPVLLRWRVLKPDYFGCCTTRVFVACRGRAWK